jgi:hypothetical protein
LSLRIEQVALGYDDSAAIANQPGVGDYPAFAYWAKVIHLHLDGREARIRLRGADYRKCDRSVDQGRDRAPVHDARELQVPLFDIEAEPCTSMLDRIEFDPEGSREVIGFELLTDQS